MSSKACMKSFWSFSSWMPLPGRRRKTLWNGQYKHESGSDVTKIVCVIKPKNSGLQLLLQTAVLHFISCSYLCLRGVYKVKILNISAWTVSRQISPLPKTLNSSSITINTSAWLMPLNPHSNCVCWNLESLLSCAFCHQPFYGEL